jgi:hypothetical protein
VSSSSRSIASSCATGSRITATHRAYDGIQRKALISGEALLLPMWGDDGAAAWTVQDASPLRSRLFLAASRGRRSGRRRWCRERSSSGGGRR